MYIFAYITLFPWKRSLNVEKKLINGIGNLLHN